MNSLEAQVNLNFMLPRGFMAESKVKGIMIHPRPGLQRIPNVVLKLQCLEVDLDSEQALERIFKSCQALPGFEEAEARPGLSRDERGLVARMPDGSFHTMLIKCRSDERGWTLLALCEGVAQQDGLSTLRDLEDHVKLR